MPVRAQLTTPNLLSNSHWKITLEKTAHPAAVLKSLLDQGLDPLQHPAGIDAIQRDLTQDGFVLRYRSEVSEDGLPAGEGVFLACSFWLVDALDGAGRHDEAVNLFERLLSLRNDVGLLSEEWDPVANRQLGNTPQAFSHFALITSGLQLHHGRAAHSNTPIRPVS